MLKLLFHGRLWRSVLVALWIVCGTVVALIVNYKWLADIYDHDEMLDNKRYILYGPIPRRY